jgi:hypothetical protein
MYGRGRGHQLLNSATNGEVNNSFRNEGATTSETTSDIVTIPSMTWRRELSPARPVSEEVQRLTEMSFRRMDEAMEEQRNARRHQRNIPDTPRSPSPMSMEEQENYVQPPRIIPMAPGSPPPPDRHGRHLPPSYDSLYDPPSTRRLPDFLQEHQQVQRELMELSEKFLETQARLMAVYQQDRQRILRRFY